MFFAGTALLTSTYRGRRCAFPPYRPIALRTLRVAAATQASGVAVLLHKGTPSKNPAACRYLLW